VSKDRSKLFAFLCVLAIALSAAAGLSVQRAQAVPGTAVTKAAIHLQSTPVTKVDLSTYYYSCR